MGGEGGGGERETMKWRSWSEGGCFTGKVGLSELSYLLIFLLFSIVESVHLQRGNIFMAPDLSKAGSIF